jgi:hypothetical protein
LSVVASNEKVPLNTPARRERQHFSARSRQYRYILCNNGEEELYDHLADPHEWKNLAHDPQFADAKKDMKRQVSQLAELNEAQSQPSPTTK